LNSLEFSLDSRGEASTLYSTVTGHAPNENYCPQGFVNIISELLRGDITSNLCHYFLNPPQNFLPPFHISVNPIGCFGQYSIKPMPKWVAQECP
jgi:hypothetical protein